MNLTNGLEEIEQRYNKSLRRWDMTLALTSVLGFATLGGMIYQSDTMRMGPPRTYVDASKTLTTLQNELQRIEEDNVGLPYKTEEVKKVEDIFQPRISKRDLENAIASVKEDISKMEGTDEFSRYNESGEGIKRIVRGLFEVMTIITGGALLWSYQTQRAGKRYRKELAELGE